ncbi:MAG TPA: hypothetical protein DD723_00535 [Candidatus Omnitrophica bacterium]|nr:MAG: hypothetical protein A2Z81_09570 [Omnitrophica WOR_2 bacterium GWA2_45_18]OGX19057.1 MAG: hypothetical protein A2Y04_02295 [Omnitrophica WOR_2 bacterium GWC2_45_7]HBR14018.1 hypothetical protein [Candidatus Omnitrophota bacterium]
MTENVLFQLIGGLGFFFLGMKTMSDGLKSIAGGKLKRILHHMTKIPLFGVLIGLLVTCFIQSSSATTIMVVGLVNAGLLTIKQAVSVIMGANVGATFTAWLISSMAFVDMTAYALPAVGIGFAALSLAKTKNKQSLGKALLGCGLLFVGLHFMVEAFSPLKNSEHIKQIFLACSENLLIGIIGGILLTVVFQSSSAAIAVVQVLAFNGVISFPSSLPIIIGTITGTIMTSQMASLGTNINARRVAMAHTLFNTTGVFFLMTIVYTGWFEGFIHKIFPGEVTSTNIMFYIAVTFSVFNILNTLVFLPFINVLVKLSIRLVPQKEESIYFGTQYLEYHLLDTPSLALEQVHNETLYMLGVCKKSVLEAGTGFFENDPRKIEKADEYASVTDNLQTEITQYIVELSQRHLLPEESEGLPVLIHHVNDLKRIGDLARDLALLADKKIEESFSLDETTSREIKLMTNELHRMFDDAQCILRNSDTQMVQNICDRKKHIDQFHEQFKQNHIQRLKSIGANLNAEFVCLEFADHLRKIADRLKCFAENTMRE